MILVEGKLAIVGIRHNFLLYSLLKGVEHVEMNRINQLNKFRYSGWLGTIDAMAFPAVRPVGSEVDVEFLAYSFEKCVR